MHLLKTVLIFLETSAMDFKYLACVYNIRDVICLVTKLLKGT